jgi:hypothetical protein
MKRCFLLVVIFLAMFLSSCMVMPEGYESSTWPLATLSVDTASSRDTTPLPAETETAAAVPTDPAVNSSTPEVTKAPSASPTPSATATPRKFELFGEPLPEHETTPREMSGSDWAAWIFYGVIFLASMIALLFIITGEPKYSPWAIWPATFIAVFLYDEGFPTLTPEISRWVSCAVSTLIVALVIIAFFATIREGGWGWTLFSAPPFVLNAFFIISTFYPIEVDWMILLNYILKTVLLGSVILGFIVLAIIGKVNEARENEPTRRALEAVLSNYDFSKYRITIDDFNLDARYNCNKCGKPTALKAYKFVGDTANWANVITMWFGVTHFGGTHTDLFVCTYCGHYWGTSEHRGGGMIRS